MTELSIILPVHNEAKVIAKNVRDIDRVLRDARITHEFICVENGSTDESLKVLQSLSHQYKNLRVIRSELGWGNAVRAGISKSASRLTCYMVSDGQIDARYIVELYQLYQNGSGISMYKIWRTKRENQTRHFISRAYNFLPRIVFGVNSRDINATPKLMETKLLKSITLESVNFALDLELLLNLKERKLRWLEIPAPSKKRNKGASTTNLKSVWEIIQWMWKIRFGGLK